jgi:hypothetical protein
MDHCVTLSLGGFHFTQRPAFSHSSCLYMEMQLSLARISGSDHSYWVSASKQLLHSISFLHYNCIHFLNAFLVRHD